jgi:DNA mismatch endonuclease (patch repair protein)
MARIRSRNTSPERILRAALRRLGLLPRANPRTPHGRPDAGLPGKFCIFVDGCFWHGCPEHYVRPRSREAFWADKLRANVLRDKRQTKALEASGWRVVRFLEHEVEEAPERCARRVLEALAKQGPSAVPWRRVAIAVPLETDARLEVRVLIDIHRDRLPRLVVARRDTRKWKRKR